MKEFLKTLPLRIRSDGLLSGKFNGVRFLIELEGNVANVYSETFPVTATSIERGSFYPASKPAEFLDALLAAHRDKLTARLQRALASL